MISSTSCSPRLKKLATDTALASSLQRSRRAQQTTSFTQTLLPPSVKSAISEIDNAHERLMKTARMAFDAQNFTLRPPEAPVIAAAEAEDTAGNSSYSARPRHRPARYPQPMNHPRLKL